MRLTIADRRLLQAGVDALERTAAATRLLALLAVVVVVLGLSAAVVALGLHAGWWHVAR